MVDTKTIKRLALEHIQRFEGLLKSADAGNKNVRIGECGHYLRLWKSIKDKGRWELLTRGECNEVADAWEDEQDHDSDHNE